MDGWMDGDGGGDWTGLFVTCCRRLLVVVADAGGAGTGHRQKFRLHVTWMTQALGIPKCYTLQSTSRHYLFGRFDSVYGTLNVLSLRD